MPQAVRWTTEAAGAADVADETAVGIAAAGGKLFLSPSNASAVLVLDPETEALRRIEAPVYGQYKWSGIALLDELLYCSPYNADGVLVRSAGAS